MLRSSNNFIAFLAIAILGVCSGVGYCQDCYIDNGIYTCPGPQIFDCGTPVNEACPNTYTEFTGESGSQVFGPVVSGTEEAYELDFSFQIVCVYQADCREKKDVNGNVIGCEPIISTTHIVGAVGGAQLNYDLPCTWGGGGGYGY